jgi:hypothetical protein
VLRALQGDRVVAGAVDDAVGLDFAFEHDAFLRSVVVPMRWQRAARRLSHQPHARLSVVDQAVDLG